MIGCSHPVDCATVARPAQSVWRLVRRETRSMGDREAVNRFAEPGTFPAIGKPPVGSSENSSTWMKRTVHIAGKLEPFFGTLDENVRLLENSLRVRTHLHESKLTIEGEQHGVAQAAKIVEEYNHASRIKELTSEEVKSLMSVLLDAPEESPRGMFEPGKLRAFGKKASLPAMLPSVTTWKRLSITT